MGFSVCLKMQLGKTRGLDGISFTNNAGATIKGKTNTNPLFLVHFSQQFFDPL